MSLCSQPSERACGAAATTANVRLFSLIQVPAPVTTHFCFAFALCPFYLLRGAQLFIFVFKRARVTRPGSDLSSFTAHAAMISTLFFPFSLFFFFHFSAAAIELAVYTERGEEMKDPRRKGLYTANNDAVIHF